MRNSECRDVTLSRLSESEDGNWDNYVEYYNKLLFSQKGPILHFPLLIMQQI